MSLDSHNVLDPTQLLQEWFDFWADFEYMPLDPPNALHIRTAMFLAIDRAIPRQPKRRDAE